MSRRSPQALRTGRRRSSRPLEILLRSLGALFLLLLLGLVAFFTSYWFLTPHLPDGSPGFAASNPGASILGTASIALTTASLTVTFIGLLTALVAIFGWRSIRERVESETRRALDREREFDYAQARFSQAVTLGLISQYLLRVQGRDVPEAATVENHHRFFLDPAITWLEASLEGGLEGEEAIESAALNVLAYLLALQGDSAHAERAYHLVEKARLQEQNGHGKASVALLLTEGTVLGTFHEELKDVSLESMERLLGIIRALPKTRPEEMREFRALEISQVVAELKGAIAARQRSASSAPPPKKPTDPGKGTQGPGGPPRWRFL